MPFCLWVRSTEIPFVIVHFFCNINTIGGTFNISIFTKVWNWIVDWITKRFFLVVWNASSWSTNWIRLSFNLSGYKVICISKHIFICKMPVMSNLILCNSKRIRCSFNIFIKFWFEIVQSILGFIMPFSLWIRSSEIPFMIVHLFSYFDTVGSSFNVSVLSKIWNWIINWITKRFFLMIWNASSWSTYWVRLNFQLSEIFSV